MFAENLIPLPSIGPDTIKMHCVMILMVEYTPIHNSRIDIPDYLRAA